MKTFLKKYLRRSGYGEEHIKEFNSVISPLREKYYRFKNDYLSIQRTKDRIKLAHDFNSELLNTLGYKNGTNSYDQPVIMEDEKIIPVRLRFNMGDKPYLYIMEMQPMIKEGDTDPDGLYEQNYIKEDWEKVLPDRFDQFEIKPEVIKEALSELFLLPEDERPQYLIMLGCPKIFLIHFEKWKFDSYLLFDLEELFSYHKFLPVEITWLCSMLCWLRSNLFLILKVYFQPLEEDSHKASYGVTKTLKKAVIFAVEV